ncbi:hypothetical protein EDL96_08270 [Kocuria soli]|uniref:Uncharacterized protein n=1 Tax=Kocuria soli TaxID=2485125 RepID=A0A3N3ZWD4_9MICC|nr:hypothetical protein EDL96_08270 [Kocuria soli]
MFHHEAGYPIAVTSKDDEGVRAGIRWCFDRMEWGDRLSVWTHLKGNLANSPLLAQLVAQSADVDHVTARGGAFIRGRGPALMAWADPNDIAKFAGRNGNSITALCVVSWNERKLRPWVSAAGPELLGDTDAWRTTTPPLDVLGHDVGYRRLVGGSPSSALWRR